MRIAIIGAGGVGGLIGGLLARSGVDVAFVARGAHLAALREHGLEVKSSVAEFRLPRVEASDDPADLAPADAALVAVKSWQVREIAPRLAPLLGERGFAVPLENGVDAADELARVLGEERVAGGLCALLSRLDGPGVVRHTGGAPKVTLGERRGGKSARVEALAAALVRAGVDARVVDDVEAAVWEKFIFIAAFGGVGAVTRAPLGVLRTLPETRALLEAAMKEVAAVARARGVRLDPGAVGRALAIVEAMPAEATASMQRDIQGGRPSELLDQTGAVVRMGRELSIAVPVNAFLFATLLPQEQAARRAAESGVDGP